MSLGYLEEKVAKQKKELQKNILLDLEVEHEQIKRQKEISENSETLESIFYTHGKAAMMSAKFYHECQLLKVPCVLDVHTQYGEVDAIIEIEYKYIIIEFKSHKRSIYEQDTKEQLERYSKHHYPVILIYESDMFCSFLSRVKRKSLDTKIYIFERNKFNLF